MSWSECSSVIIEFKDETTEKLKVGESYPQVFGHKKKIKSMKW